MFHIKWFATAVVLLASLEFAALAQEPELRLGTLTTSKDTLLKSSPSNTGTTLQSIPAGQSLKWVQKDKAGKWYQVVPATGPLAWVRADSVGADSIVQPPPAPSADSIATASQKCVADLGSCTRDGCEAAGTAHALLNNAKRTFASGDPATFSFADFDSLQTASAQKVQLGAEIPDRSVLKGLVNDAGEGTMVQITAFLAPGTGPHPNTGESVNCNLTGSANNDFHIPVTEEAGQDEFASIVAEMIPQGEADGTIRNAGWTLLKLKKVQSTRRQVKIVGGLLYDNMHLPNGDPGHPIDAQPKRFSLWEIHPISKFFVCNKPSGGCNINTDSDWTPLETFH